MKTRCDTGAKGNPEIAYGLEEETSTILPADAKPQITTQRRLMTPKHNYNPWKSGVKEEES